MDKGSEAGATTMTAALSASFQSGGSGTPGWRVGAVRR